MNTAPERQVITFPEGHRYEGEYRDDNANGRGTMTWPNGDRYAGEWRNGSRHGRGSMQFASGEKYEGEWRDDKMTGRGIMSFQNGDRYEGELVDGIRNGRGTMVYGNNGGRYEGEWRNNDANGRGVMVWANGQRYDGQWLNGNRHGYGLQVAAPGKQYQGEWREDKPLVPIENWSSAPGDSRASAQAAQKSAAPVAGAPSSPPVTSSSTSVASTFPSPGTTPSSAATTSVPAMPVYGGIKKRLAVLRLENKTKTPVPDASWQIGEGLTEMLVTELFRTGRFVMIERAALSDIVKEQELGQTGLIQKETVTKVGEMLGAQMLIAGAVTEFAENASGGGGGFGVAGFALQLRSNSAHVAVDIRLVDSSTGEILKSFNADAKAEERSVGFAAQRGKISFGSDAFNKTPLGQATREAIAKAIKFIVSEMDTVPWTGRVVQAKGNEIIVNAGTNVNLRPGATLAVFSKGEELRDPATGVLLGSRDAHVGTLVLTHTEEKFSVGTFSGNGAVKRGDLLKPQ